MDSFLWQLLLMWAGRHAAWHCCGPGGPRARSRWRVEGKEEGVVVRTFMWDTSKHILVICYSNPGNSVQMHGITSWRSRVCNTVTAAAVRVLDFFGFQWATSPPALSYKSFPFISLFSSEQSCYTVCHANKSKCATNELSYASSKLGRIKEWLLRSFLTCLDMILKGLFKHGNSELGNSVHGGKYQKRNFSMWVDINLFFWTIQSICLLW